jgi:hypothetical protein
MNFQMVISPTKFMQKYENLPLTFLFLILVWNILFSDPSRFRFTHETSFVRHHTSWWNSLGFSFYFVRNIPMLIYLIMKTPKIFHNKSPNFNRSKLSMMLRPLKVGMESGKVYCKLEFFYWDLMCKKYWIIRGSFLLQQNHCIWINFWMKNF